MLRILFYIEGKLKLNMVFFTSLSIVPKIFTDFRNYCLIKPPMFLPKNYSVKGNFLPAFLSKILRLWDFYSSSFVQPLTWGIFGFILVLVYPSLRIKQASSYSYTFLGTTVGGRFWLLGTCWLYWCCCGCWLYWGCCGCWVYWGCCGGLGWLYWGCWWYEFSCLGGILFCCCCCGGGGCCPWCLSCLCTLMCGCCWL